MKETLTSEEGEKVEEERGNSPIFGSQENPATATHHANVPQPPQLGSCQSCAQPTGGDDVTTTAKEGEEQIWRSTPDHQEKYYYGKN